MRKTTLRLACALAITAGLVSGTALLAPAALAKTADPTAKPAQTVTWKQSKKNSYCYVNGVKCKGLTTVGSKTYSFTKKGAQRLGWFKIADDYYYFRIKCGAGGYMLKRCVQNGIALDSKGRAKVNAAAQAELDLLTKANSIVRSVTKPADSVHKKLRKAWRWMQKNCRETSSHKFHRKLGWHRSYAHEILFDRHGACESMGAGFAYLAQACGAKRCSAVATGGHGWAEIDNRIYDPEWSRHVSGEVYDKPLSYFPHGGATTATIQPRTRVWSKTRARVSAKQGLVKAKGSYYYYRNGKKAKSKWVSVGSKKYYFTSSGKAATYCTKVKGKYYVFTKKGILATGSKTRVVTVGKRKFQVTAKGAAKAGWNKSKTRRYAKTGELMRGIWSVDGKLWALSAKGDYNASKTSALRAAAKTYGDAATLLGLMGKPVTVKRGLGICLIVPGHEDEDGSITKYTYGHAIVEVFVSEASGREYLLNVLDR